MKTIHRKTTFIAKLNGTELRVMEGNYVMATGKSFKACAKINGSHDLEFLERSVFPAGTKWQVLTKKKFDSLKKKPEVIKYFELVQKHGSFVQSKDTLKVGDVIDALAKLDRNTPIAVYSDDCCARETGTVDLWARGEEQVVVFQTSGRAHPITQDETDFNDEDEDLPEGYNKETIADVWG